MTIELRYFSPEQDPKLFACPCKCSAEPSATFLRMLDKCRSVAGVPFIITSGPRCPKYNEKINGSRNSAHIGGCAADISVRDSRTRFLIIKSALSLGVNRIGIADTFVHLDNSEEDHHDKYVMWTY